MFIEPVFLKRIGASAGVDAAQGQDVLYPRAWMRFFLMGELLLEKDCSGLMGLMGELLYFPLQLGTGAR